MLSCREHSFELRTLSSSLISGVDTFSVRRESPGRFDISHHYDLLGSAVAGLAQSNIQAEHGAVDIDSVVIELRFR